MSNPYLPPHDGPMSPRAPQRNPTTGATGTPRPAHSSGKRLQDLLTPSWEEMSTPDVRNRYELLRRELCRTKYKLTQVDTCPHNPDSLPGWRVSIRP